MAEKYTGKCSNCGKDNIVVSLIDEETSLCEKCIDELDYIECDECEELWLWDAVKFYNLKDGRTLCENCAEELLDDEIIVDDDIESISDHT